MERPKATSNRRNILIGSLLCVVHGLYMGQGEGRGSGRRAGGELQSRWIYYSEFDKRLLLLWNYDDDCILFGLALFTKRSTKKKKQRTENKRKKNLIISWHLKFVMAACCCCSIWCYFFLLSFLSCSFLFLFVFVKHYIAVKRKSTHQNEGNIS